MCAVTSPVWTWGPGILGVLTVPGPWDSLPSVKALPLPSAKPRDSPHPMPGDPWRGQIDLWESLIVANHYLVLPTRWHCSKCSASSSSLNSHGNTIPVPFDRLKTEAQSAEAICPKSACPELSAGFPPQAESLLRATGQSPPETGPAQQEESGGGRGDCRRGSHWAPRPWSPAQSGLPARLQNPLPAS